MQIEFSPEVALQLETATVQAQGMEFSGFGFVEIRDRTFYVYEIVILDVGSSVYTQIDPEKYIHLLDRADAKQMKVWFHRHPVGNGIPGPHNWSGTDERTCRFEPLGTPFGMQDSVKWALAVVRTPYGWVGRYDTFGKNGKTVHLPVVLSYPEQVNQTFFDIENAKRSAEVQHLRKSVPFVHWEDEEAFADFDEADYEEWLAENGLDGDDSDREAFATQHMFWD